MSDQGAQRRGEVADRLDEVRARIADACAEAGRAAGEVTLTVVTKTYPAADVSLLASLGVSHVGEARHPEARDKHAVVGADLVWHFVGALQTNKAAAVASYCDVVESVDRPRLVTALERGASAHDPNARLRADHPAATAMSAGMSGDLEQAVRAGATHVRIGRAVLGERPALQ